MSSDSKLAVESIQQTVTGFRAQCQDWRREFDLLLDELDGLPTPCEASEEALGQMIDTLTGHQHRVAQRQDDIGEELVAVHSLVERQVEMLDRLLGSDQQLQAQH